MNQFTISGNLNKKPELKVSARGVKYLSFALAVNEKYEKKDGEQVNETHWFNNLVVFGDKAEELANVLDKGTLVKVTGKLVIEKEEVDGKKSEKLKLKVFNVELIPRKE